MSQTVKFGVRAESGQRSSTWRMWTPDPPRSDIYVGCRELKGQLKASLHESGEWHTSFSREFHQNNFEDTNRPDSRFTDRWQRPPEVLRGLVHAYTIIIPWKSVTTVPATDMDALGIVWLAPPPPGQCVRFDVLISDPSANIGSHPGHSTGSSFVGSMKLANGGRAWLVSTMVPYEDSPSQTGRLRLFKGHEITEIEGQQVRALGYGTAPDGVHVVQDLGVLSST